MSKSHSKKNLSVPTFSLSWCIWVHLGDSTLFNFVQLVALLNFTCILRMTCSTCKTIGVAQGTLFFLAEIRNKLFEQPSYASSLRFFWLAILCEFGQDMSSKYFFNARKHLGKRGGAQQTAFEEVWCRVLVKFVDLEIYLHPRSDLVLFERG